MSQINYTGTDLNRWGFNPGPWYAKGIDVANKMAAAGNHPNNIIAALRAMAPPDSILLREPGDVPFTLNITPEMDGDQENIDKVSAHMTELMRLPSAVAGAVMPDACPSGQEIGTIPVGGIVATRGTIHPGMHSADICCSMAITVFDRDTDPTKVLDAGMALSHFGYGGRPRGQQLALPYGMLDKFEGNQFLRGMMSVVRDHFGTQGDGNHFFYVGRTRDSNRVCLVTHHGSRKPGALLYKEGMKKAEVIRRREAPDVAKHNAYLYADTHDGEAYWDALQIIREWTKASHFAIHNLIVEHLGLRTSGRFWNEHNFVFRKPDGLFYHAKGATPAFPGYADDASGLTLIPMNMAAPILITEGLNNPNGLGFAPHGAGRNLSRTAFMKRNAGKTVEELFNEMAPGIDARSYSGKQDVSELPGAYKSHEMVTRQIESFKLARIVEYIDPIGSIMAGDQDEPWKRVKEHKRLAREAAGQTLQ